MCSGRGGGLICYFNARNADNGGMMMGVYGRTTPVSCMLSVTRAVICSCPPLAARNSRQEMYLNFNNLWGYRNFRVDLSENPI